MFKVKSTKKLAAVAAAAVAMGGMVAPVAADITVQNIGETPVNYDNRNLVDPDNNGTWGVVIPTSITLTDDNKVADGGIELVGYNGFSLDDFQQLDVKGEVQSANSYKLLKETTNADDGATYEYKLASTTFTANANQQPIGTNMTKDAPKLDGTVTLKTPSTKKGAYKDTLKYYFEAETLIRK